ncbi:hypothetical protein ILYODFUR_020007, partial [Ilyodon furcidens]
MGEGISVPCPPSNTSIWTLSSLLKSPSQFKQHQRNHLNNFSFDNLDPVFLYPWRPDRTHLLKILQLKSLDCFWHNKTLFHLIYFLRSVLLYV